MSVVPNRYDTQLAPAEPMFGSGLDEVCIPAGLGIDGEPSESEDDMAHGLGNGQNVVVIPGLRKRHRERMDNYTEDLRQDGNPHFVVDPNDPQKRKRLRVFDAEWVRKRFEARQLLARNPDYAFITAVAGASNLDDALLLFNPRDISRATERFLDTIRNFQQRRLADVSVDRSLDERVLRLRKQLDVDKERTNRQLQRASNFRAHKAEYTSSFDAAAAAGVKIAHLQFGGLSEEQLQEQIAFDTVLRKWDASSHGDGDRFFRRTDFRLMFDLLTRRAKTKFVPHGLEDKVFALDVINLLEIVAGSIFDTIGQTPNLTPGNTAGFITGKSARKHTDEVKRRLGGEHPAMLRHIVNILMARVLAELPELASKIALRAKNGGAFKSAGISVLNEDGTVPGGKYQTEPELYARDLITLGQLLFPDTSDSGVHLPGATSTDGTDNAVLLEKVSPLFVRHVNNMIRNFGNLGGASQPRAVVNTSERATRSTRAQRRERHGFDYDLDTVEFEPASVVGGTGADPGSLLGDTELLRQLKKLGTNPTPDNTRDIISKLVGPAFEFGLSELFYVGDDALNAVLPHDEAESVRRFGGWAGASASRTIFLPPDEQFYENTVVDFLWAVIAMFDSYVLSMMMRQLEPDSVDPAQPDVSVRKLLDAGPIVRGVQRAGITERDSRLLKKFKLAFVQKMGVRSEWRAIWQRQTSLLRRSLAPHQALLLLDLADLTDELQPALAEDEKSMMKLGVGAEDTQRETDEKRRELSAFIQRRISVALTTDTDPLAPVVGGLDEKELALGFDDAFDWLHKRIENKGILEKVLGSIRELRGGLDATRAALDGVLNEQTQRASQKQDSRTKQLEDFLDQETVAAPDWALAPENTGVIELKADVTTAINSGYQKVMRNCVNLRGLTLDELKNHPATHTEFAKFVSIERALFNVRSPAFTVLQKTKEQVLIDSRNSMQILQGLPVIYGSNSGRACLTDPQAQPYNQTFVSPTAFGFGGMHCGDEFY